ncbi:MAG: glycosyltransferase [Hyphomonas sp.]|nr:glycosyltransferase [Hyphomonas sp.]
MIVILSTLNGETRLRRMLEAMLNVRLPAGTKFHVVDNGSEDGTLDLLAEYAGRLPLVIYNQPVRGKNHCLNLVLAAVRKTLDPEELVVLTDDDILPCPEWLEELQAAGQAYPDCDVFGGRILPHWPSRGAGKLDSVQRHFGVLFSLTSAQEGPISCDAAWGPNMAVRGRVFKMGYTFDPQFGPNGQMGYPMGSETELMERLDAAGHRAWFAERACVRHIIRAAQLDTVNIIQRAFRHGYGVGWRRQRDRGITRLASLQFNALRALVLAQFRRLVSSPNQMLLAEYEDAWARGFAHGSLSEYRRASAAAKFQTEFPERRSVSRDPLNH